MPPSSVQSESRVGVAEHDQLTDHDFDVLFNIASTAQKDPNARARPLRALFNAYDAVCEELDLQPGHDSVYFRYILRLGGVPGDGTLLEKFKTLFKDVGIQIEFDDDDDNAQIAPNKAESPTDSQHDKALSREHFNHNVKEVATPDHTVNSEFRPRANSTPSRIRPQRPQAHGIASPRNDPAQAFRPNDRKNNLGQIDLVKQTKLTSTTDASGGSEADEQPNQQRLKQWQESVSQARIDPFSEDSTPALMPSAFRPYQNFGSKGHMAAEASESTGSFLDTRSEGNSVLQAQSFYHGHLARLTRRILHLGCHKALQRQVASREMYSAAKNHDRIVLLGQSFDEWLAKTRSKREEVRTEQFFSRLESRADKARDLYLLSKAFTHWAQCAHDEVQKTSKARRHILRTKYFKAWRDITVVNAFKIRRHILAKFLSNWKSKMHLQFVVSDQALIHYHENLVRDRLREWFWKLCEIRAPEWRARRTKAKIIQKLINTYREQLEREGWVEGLSRRRLLYKTFRPWMGKLDVLLSHERVQATYNTNRMLSDVFSSWFSQTQLAPRFAFACSKLDLRLVQSIFGSWLQKARLSLYAAEMDRTRLAQNAWTTWNDLLRVRVISIRIDERVQIQALYRLVLAERKVLLQRLFQRRLKQKFLTRLVQGWTLRRSKTSQLEEEASVHYHSNLLRRVWDRWRLQIQLVNGRSQLAEAFYSPKLLSTTLDTWISESEHVNEMRKAADLGHYFLLAKKSFKQWQNTLKATQKEKRREAFARVRRRWKVHVKADVIALWRAKTIEATTLRDQGDQLYQQYLISLRSDAFAAWRSRLSGLANMDQECLAFRQDKTRQIYLQRLVAMFRASKELEMVAIDHYQLQTVNIAATCLRRVAMRVFEYKIRARSADDFARRHEKRNFRNIFRHWRETTNQFRALGDLDQSLSQHQTPMFGLGGSSTTAGVSHRTETWSEQGESSEQGDGAAVGAQDDRFPQTPRPGYLNTPSKRAAHAKAMFNLSTTTPAGTPPARFLASKRKSGLPTPGSRLSLAPSTLGRSLLASRRPLNPDASFSSSKRLGS